MNKTNLTDKEQSGSDNQDGQQLNQNVGGDAKTSDSGKLLQFTQDALNAMMADRAQQAKRSILKDIGIEDVDTLKAMVSEYKEIEAKRVAAEDAQKTELQKMQEQLEATRRIADEREAAIAKLKVETAITRLAPTKDVPNDRIEALLKLMDLSKLLADNGVTDETIGKALDETLKANPFLVQKQGNGIGSPVNRQPLPIQKPDDNRQSGQPRRYGI